MNWWVRLSAYCILVGMTVAAVAMENPPVVEHTTQTVTFFNRLIDRVPEMGAAIIVLWLVFRFLEHTHEKVGKSLDGLSNSIQSLETFLRSRKILERDGSSKTRTD